MINKKKKVIALSVVALVLASLVVFGLTTYAWIDDVKLVEFNNDDAAQNNAPLKTGTDINATVNIKKGKNTVDLGNMLTNDDITYEYTEGNETKRHIKYDIAAQEKANIDKNKGYFYESGDMHLSGCYSDGEIFCFPRYVWDESENAFVIRGYREGNKDDENVNYISFTTKVSSPDATVDFWFDSMPTIQGKNAGGSTVDVSSYARYAIIVDGECHVYSSSGTANTCNAGLTGTTAVNGVRKTSNYTYGDNTNTTADRGANSNTLFSIKKGGTVNMTVKIWLEGGVGSNVTASNINLKLVSSWGHTRKLWIEDKTTNGSGGSWLDDDSAKLYVTFPEFLKDAASVSDWPNASSGFYPLTVDDSTHKGYVEVPLVYNNEKMILYRCNNSQIGWNNNASGTVQRSDYNVYCWNWWQTYTPNTYKDETYTLYGGSMDSTANGYFNSINQGFTVTNKGYGTWGAVEEIKVFSHYNNNDLASKDSGKAMYVVDHSDENTSGETYIYEMYRSGTTSSDPWKTYVPAGSAKIQFRYFGGASGLSWGYSSWNSENPQRRPLASTGLYPYNATEYQLAAIFDNVNGWGYWRDTNSHEYDKVYFVKKGSTYAYANNVYAYMYDDNVAHKNAEWNANANPPTYGYQMTRMKDASNNDVNWSDNSSWVMQSDSARPGSNIFNHLIFNDGSGGHQTSELKVFPGCFYNPDDGKWYGAINDNGRAANTDNNATNNDGTTEVTTTVPTGDGLYAYGQLLGGSSYVEYAKFSSTGVGGYVVLNLTAGNSYQFTLSKKVGTNTVEYGNNVSNVGPVLSSTNKGEWRFINDTGHNQKIKLDVRTTGKYKISIKEVQSTNFNLEFEYLSS